MGSDECEFQGKNRLNNLTVRGLTRNTVAQRFPVQFAEHGTEKTMHRDRCLQAAAMVMIGLMHCLEGSVAMAGDGTMGNNTNAIIQKVKNRRWLGSLDLYRCLGSG